MLHGEQWFGARFALSQTQVEPIALAPREQDLEAGGGSEGHVAREHAHDRVRSRALARGREPRFEPGERTERGCAIEHEHVAELSMPSLRPTGEQRAFDDRPQALQRVLDQRALAQLEARLVGAHAAARAPTQDEAEDTLRERIRSAGTHARRIPADLSGPWRNR